MQAHRSAAPVAAKAKSGLPAADLMYFYVTSASFFAT